MSLIIIIMPYTLTENVVFKVLSHLMSPFDPSEVNMAGIIALFNRCTKQPLRN